MADFRYNEKGCQSCGTEQVEVTIDFTPKSATLLCRFCYGTGFGDMVTRPEAYPAGTPELAMAMIESLHIVMKHRSPK